MKSLLITLASAHAGCALGLFMRGDDFWQMPWLITMMCVCTLINIHARENNGN